VHALVAPPVWRAEVALALNRLSTAAPVRLVLGVITPGTADPLNLGAIVVVRHAARAVTIVNFGVVGVASDAVEERGWFE
jgi:hypothetical protein